MSPRIPSLSTFVATVALLAGLSVNCGRSRAAEVPRFAPHEETLTAAGSHANPYLAVSAEATLTPPGGRAAVQAPLFWDGGQTWRLRIAPDETGPWRWTVRSSDPGLDGRSGSFTCVASTRRGSLQRMADSPRHFQYQNGERVWFMGDTAWAYVTDSAEEQHDRAAAERYIARRAAQGFTAIHLMLLNEAGWPNAGGPPWFDLAQERINPAYFQEADRRIAFANAHGVVTGLALAWGNKGRNEPYSWGRFPDFAARRRYARYVAARYGAYDVYFLVSGEWHGEVRARRVEAEDVRREFTALGDALRAADPHRRLIGIHPMTAQGSTREFTPAAWMDFADYQQNYLDLHGRALQPRVVARPVVNSEYAYFLRDQNGDGQVDKPHSYTLDDIRHATWDLVMAGAYVVTGFGSTYMGGHRHPTPFLPDDPRNRPWEEQVGHVRQFFTRLDYWRLEPHDELLSCAVARGADRENRADAAARLPARTRAPATTYWCLSDADRTHLVYVRGTREPVRLAVAAGRAWRTVRFDPRTGQSVDAPATPVPEGLALLPPDERDWVFLVQRG